MSRRAICPMPTVTVNGSTYKLRSRKTVIPNFETMGSMAITLWMLRNTTPRGYSRRSNPLVGLGGIITIN